MKKNIALLFIVTALAALLLASLAGCIAALQFLFPQSFKFTLSFQQVRPIHVSAVLSWIVMAATGCIYYFLKDKIKTGATISHFLFFLTAGILIFTSYFFEVFAGRKYFEFHPVFSLLLIAGWISFGINIWPLVFKKMWRQPVYYWMWGLGIFFFIFTLAENYLWLFSWFNHNIIRDVTVQWKAMGAMVGSWNLLVYGTSIFVMHKISNDHKMARSPLVFSLFFLGLANLMFNWGHHTYVVPTKFYVREIAYLISMTELIILGKIIYDWRKKLQKAPPATEPGKFLFAQKFMYAADVWILLNLVQAILMSVPAINIYIHGTHVVVAHAMGTTIGINSMILLSAIFYVFAIEKSRSISLNKKWFLPAFYILNISLLVFWLSLTGAGIIKGILTYHSNYSFAHIMQTILPWLYSFTIAGVGIFIAFVLIAFPLIFIILPIKARRVILFPVRVFAYPKR